MKLLIYIFFENLHKFANRDNVGRHSNIHKRKFDLYISPLVELFVKQMYSIANSTPDSLLIPKDKYIQLFFLYFFVTSLCIYII